MGTITSPSLNSKLKVMYSEKLKKDDLEDLIKQNTIKDALIILKSKIPSLEDLPNNASRIELEDSLDNILIYDIKKILKYLQGKNKEIFEQYILKYKIETIKKLYEDLFVLNLKLTNNYWIQNLFTDLKTLVTTTKKDDFIEKIPEKNIKDIFANSNSDFERENKLDKYYFENFLKTIKGKNKKLEDLLKTQIDLLNILWAYRCAKYYGVINQDILINCFYKIDLNIIKKIENSNNLDDLKQSLEGTIYKDIIQNDIEIDIKRFLYKKSKKTFRNEMLDLSMIISYLKILETEKENIVTIIESIRYKMPSENIQRKIII